MRRLIVVAVLVTACSAPEGSTDTTIPPTTSTTLPETTVTTTTTPPFSLSSPAFSYGTEIPSEHTCDGADVSPELNVVGIPEDAESLAIVFNDPGAPLGTWDHWVEFDISVEAGTYAIERSTEPIGVQGVNSWNLAGYRGPCPPEGEEHEYVFTVYAVSGSLGLSEGANSSQVYAAMEGNVISATELTGTYAR